MKKNPIFNRFLIRIKPKSFLKEYVFHVSIFFGIVTYFLVAVFYDNLRSQWLLSHNHYTTEELLKFTSSESYILGGIICVLLLVVVGISFCLRVKSMKHF